jgi:hypothetical protein
MRAEERLRRVEDKWVLLTAGAIPVSSMLFSAVALLTGRLRDWAAQYARS